MPVATAKTITNAADEDGWPHIDSRYRLIVVAALRNKQLLRGDGLKSNRL